MGQSPNPDWLGQWQALSRNMMDAWQGMARQPGLSPPPASPWPEAFEPWMRLMASGGGAQSETVERVIDSARGYANFMQAALASGMSGGDASAGWSEAFRHGFAIPGVGAMPFDANAMLHAFREMPAQGFGAMRAPVANLDDLKAWMSLPTFGLAREHQEHQQQLSVAWIEYQERTARYNALMLKAAQRGFELFEGKLIEREQPGRQIETLRGLYDLWVDAAEEGYAEIALSGEFRDAWGAMVNAQMLLRSLIQKQVEQVSTSLGMPTRSEIDNIGERLQALRRELRTRDGDSELAHEVARLRAEVAALKTAERPTPAAKPQVVAAKASPSKPTPSKPRRPARKPAAKVAPRRAAAAAAPGNFSSRIAEFADASLGRGKKSAKSKKS